MAPRRGGYYGSGGSSSSSCYYCLEPLSLRGYDWRNPTVTGLFAMQIILLIVLVVCMVLTRRFKWIRERGTDKLRNSGYLIAAVCVFCDNLLRVIITGLAESRTEVTHLFYLAYMLQITFSQIGYVLIVAIIARTITEDVGVLSQKIASFGIGILWAVSIINLGFNIAVYAEYMALENIERIAGLGSLYMGITAASYLFAFTLYLTALAILAILKRRSTGTLLMLIGVIPALFLMNLMDLVVQAVFNFGDRRTTVRSLSLSYANAFIIVLASMVIFLIIALIGSLRQRHSDADGLTQDPKLAQTGPYYVAVGPYAPPPAPYNPHGTQLPAGQPAPYGSPVPFETQGQYGAPQQQGQQPFQYTPPQYGQAGQQMQYAQYPAPGQFAPEQPHAEMSNTPVAGVAKTVSPVQYAAPVAVSPAPYGSPSSSSVSPPPQHDPYQMHMQHKTYQ